MKVLSLYPTRFAQRCFVRGYAKGVFPWSASAPYLWFFTDPRLVLDPTQLIISHSLRKRIRDALQNVYRREGIKHKLEIFLDHAPEDVLSGCAGKPSGAGRHMDQPSFETRIS